MSFSISKITNTAKEKYLKINVMGLTLQVRKMSIEAQTVKTEAYIEEGQKVCINLYSEEEIQNLRNQPAEIEPNNKGMGPKNLLEQKLEEVGNIYAVKKLALESSFVLDENEKSLGKLMDLIKKDKNLPSENEQKEFVNELMEAIDMDTFRKISLYFTGNQVDEKK